MNSKTVFLLCIALLLVAGCSTKEMQKSSSETKIENKAINAAASMQGKALFEAKCTSCHMTRMPTDEEFKTLLAPAIMGVMRHVKEIYPDKKEAVDFMVDYVLNPSKEKAICMPQKIERFGLMPSQKESVTKEELKVISEYLYDNYPPKNFRGMGKGNRF